jgi:hypothetical protein
MIDHRVDAMQLWRLDGCDWSVTERRSAVDQIGGAQA